MTSSLTHAVLNNVALSHSGSTSSSACPAALPVQTPVFTTNSAALLNESKTYTNLQWSGDTIQNGTIWIGDIPGANQVSIPQVIPNGFITPNYVGPFKMADYQGPFNVGPLYPPILMIPDLDLLEEGVHDIKGGKIIIKKIKVTEAQLDEALSEELGHDASDAEKAKFHEELSEIAASEEREV
jgi:hypothetical protein